MHTPALEYLAKYGESRSRSSSSSSSKSSKTPSSSLSSYSDSTKQAKKRSSSSSSSSTDSYDGKTPTCSSEEEQLIVPESDDPIHGRIRIKQERFTDDQIREIEQNINLD